MFERETFRRKLRSSVVINRGTDVLTQFNRINFQLSSTKMLIQIVCTLALDQWHAWENPSPYIHHCCKILIQEKKLTFYDTRFTTAMDVWRWVFPSCKHLAGPQVHGPLLFMNQKYTNLPRGYSHWLEYAYARTDMMCFWQFMCQKGYGFHICVPERIGFWSAKGVPERLKLSKFSLNWHFMINFPALLAKFHVNTQTLNYNISGISIYC